MTILRRGRGPAYRPAPVARAHQHRNGRATRAIRGDRGSTTAEFAVAMPAVILLLLTVLTAISAVLTKLECVDAARQAARAEARGESGTATGERAGPRGAHVTVTDSGDTIRATVQASVPPLGGLVPGLSVSGTAVAEPEPGAAP